MVFKKFSSYVDRFLDVFIAVIGLAVFGIPMLFISLLIRFKMGAPVLFCQQRPGLQGKIFTLYKFRTMANAKDKVGQPLPDGQRLLPLGRFLRASSLDELPQLLNVLKGDIRIVGPRPLLIEYLPLYTKEQARRHEVKPGITGWAQINGRNALSWEKKFELDVWYVDHHSFWLDLKIIVLTALKVIRRSQINQPGQATAERFTGTHTE
jgi:sugar transferase EpsL